MGKNRGIFVILAVFLLAAVVDAPASAAEKRATLRLINPEIFLKDVRIKHIVATLDGYAFGDCWADRRQPNNVCIKPRPIEPGPHILELLLDPLATTYFQSVDKFTAGMSGEWTLDLKGLTVDSAKTEDYLTQIQGPAPVQSCRAALGRLASRPSCTAAEFGALEPALAETRGACAKGVPDSDKDAAAADFAAVVDSHFRLDLPRCYTRAEIRKLPAHLTSFGRPDGRWLIETGSWRWARQPELDLSDAKSVAEGIEQLQALLPAATKRFAVVDSVIAAYIQGNVAPVHEAAMKAPFSLDPETPEGHRNLLLLGHPGRFYREDYADFVADKVAADRELDCARSDLETELLVSFFIQKGKLSARAYGALVALAGRVPADLGFGACRKAIDLSLESTVDSATRLRQFFALDCAKARTPERRGEMLKAFLDSNPRDDNTLQQQTRQEFGSCLVEKKQTVTVSITAQALEKAQKSGCKIEPNAACSNVALRRADLHGADLHGARLDQADFAEADLKGVNLAHADLRRTVFDKADLAGADLTGANLEHIYARKTDLHGVKLAGTGTMLGANLLDSDLHGADLAGVVLSEGLLQGVDFSGANLSGANLSAARLEKANLRGSDLRRAKLDGANLKGADLTGAKLDGASLREANLSGTNFRDAVLGNADLTKSSLSEVTWIDGCKLVPQTKCPGVDLHGLSLIRVDLRGADLAGANLQNADLESAWLEGADLHGADLRGANIAQAILRGANLAGANLEGAQGGDPQFEGANMSETILRDGKKCALGAKADRLHDC
jgi:uncharacterized protein YjbI with pentapeptide repeats